ncbi:MAG: phage tail tape measure protein [Rhodopirellula sp.]|nr:phage tail tape measure protein [Rhodopirellula sp.]HCA36841.1 phage tail tape measure protein [Gammaproteobacteria bacterium]
MPGENMADLKKTVELIFGGVDDTGGAINSVGRGLDGLVNKTGNVTGVLADITDSIVKLDLALAAAGVGITAFAVKLSDDFDTAFGEIATLIGQPADNLRDFQDQILSYSETSTASLDAITSATYSAISAGVDYKDSLELLAAAETLSIAGRADLGETTAALVSTLNAFGASADQAGAFADDFFTTVQLGQTTIPELASTIGRLAPIADAAGLSFKEIGAAIATITSGTGTSTAETITGIRAALNSIIGPSKQATELANELGIEFNASALASKGLAGFLQEVTDKTGGNVTVLRELFGTQEALVPVLALTGENSERLSESLEKYGSNAGDAVTASKELTNTLGLLGQTLQNNVNSALIELGSNLTDETRSAVESITSIFNSLGNEIKLDDGAFAPILNGLEGLAQDIDQKLQVIAQNFPEALSGLDFSDLLESFGDLGGELDDLFVGLFGNVDLSTVEGLQSAMQRVVDAFTALVQVSSGIAEGLEPLFQAIGKGIEEFEQLDGTTKKTVGEILGVGKAIDTVLPALGGLAGGLSSVGTGLTALAGAQGFKAIIGNLNSIKGIAATTAGKGGLLGLALTGGYAFGTFINDYIEEEFGSIGSKLYQYFNADEIKSLAESFAPATGEIKKLQDETEELRQISQRYDEMNKTLGQTMGYTTEITEEQRQEFNRYAQQLVDNANKTEEFSGSQRGITDAVEELNRQVSASGGALGEVSKTTEVLAENNKALQLGYDEATGKINSFSGTIVKSGNAMEDTAKKTEKAVEKSEEFFIEMEKIASNERIKNIEAKISLDIAEVEANAKQVEAIADTISDTFESTGKTITDLFSGFDDASRLTQISINEQLRKENEYREQSLNDQSKLTEAQIEYIRQKTRQLQNGDAMIKVSGDGLQPHLEALMFSLLEGIQVRMNAQGEELLLRLNG